MTNLIALIGPRFSGKTTLANQLKNYNWKTTSFATPIKNMLRTLLANQNNLDLDIVERMLYGDLKEIPTKYLNGVSPRYVMQTLGTEWRDLIHRDLWLDIWKRSIDLKKEKIIVDDLRFIHEANRIKSLDGILVYISRNQNRTPDFHISEQELKKIIPDFTIDNNHNPEDMIFQLNHYLKGEIF